MENILEIIKQPWHWAIAGLLIGLCVPALLIIGNKKFGISSSFRHICAMCVPAKLPFFQYEWKQEKWNLYFVSGILIGGFAAGQFLSNPDAFVIADATRDELSALGIRDFSHQLPEDIFSISNLFTLKGLIFFVIGGFLVGFGTRYAGGCTSGHSIMGLSNLQMSSLIATLCFMAGGFLSANLIIPFILKQL